MLRGRSARKAVDYEVADELVVAYDCHCSNCRASTGSAFLPWGEIEPEKLRFSKGTDSLLVDGDAAAAHAMRCGQCWSLLYWAVHHHDHTWLRVPCGTLIDEPTLEPIAHMFVGSRIGCSSIALGATPQAVVEVEEHDPGDARSPARPQRAAASGGS
jgi:hypothetical protein